jgi:hypothetical protein
MYPLFNQELARQHQADLARAATHERMSRQIYKQAHRISLLASFLQRMRRAEPDFVAIRCDLRSTLSEWYLETGTGHLDAAIDVFMQRLRMRLGYSERRKQTRAIP